MRMSIQLFVYVFLIVPESVHNEDEDAINGGLGPSRAGGMEVGWNRIRDGGGGGGGRARGEVEVGGEGGGGELCAGEEEAPREEVDSRAVETQQYHQPCHPHHLRGGGPPVSQPLLSSHPCFPIRHHQDSKKEMIGLIFVAGC